MQEMQKLHPQAIYQGLGGSFDVYTGNVKRAPKLWVNLGLEWAYRWIREPKIRTKRNLLLFEFLLKLKTNQFNNQ
jgi:UDP-N-acetyl-D-mannosaminouronate:lipid I N-acetyl-D-mannosaminouronosyltransferase